MTVQKRNSEASLWRVFKNWRIYKHLRITAKNSLLIKPDRCMLSLFFICGLCHLSPKIDTLDGC